jgi:uncharacterized protein YndB with AHSA1/START domain
MRSPKSTLILREDATMSRPTPQKTSQNDAIATRVMEAPPEAVWKAWTEPEFVMRWWGPEHFTSPACKLDFREGGTSLVCMRSPQGQDFYNTWTYLKIELFRRIEFLQNLADQDARPLDPAAAGLRADFPKDVRTVVTFKSVAGKTELSVSEYGFPDSQMFEFAQLGLEQCLDKMAAIFA